MLRYLATTKLYIDTCIDGKEEAKKIRDKIASLYECTMQLEDSETFYSNFSVPGFLNVVINNIDIRDYERFRLRVTRHIPGDWPDEKLEQEAFDFVNTYTDFIKKIGRKEQVRHIESVHKDLIEACGNLRKVPIEGYSMSFPPDAIFTNEEWEKLLGETEGE